MKIEDKSRLRAVIAGDVEPYAALVWTFLRHCVPQGTSIMALKSAFKVSAFDVPVAVEILLELGLAKMVGLKVKAYDAPIERGAGGRWEVVEGGTDMLEVSVDALMAVYDNWRMDREYHQWLHKAGDKKHWVKIANFIKDQHVDPVEYFDVATKATSGWSGLPVPPPGMLASDFVQQKWATRTDWLPWHRKEAQKGVGGHAGSEYRPAKAIRRRLTSAGFDVTTEQARYLDDLATQLKDDSTTPVPKKWAAAVDHLVKQG